MGKLIILKNGRIVDPVAGRDETGDLWLHGGKIVESGSVPEKSPTIIDVSHKWIVPGLIDMHVHLREPGEEYKETIESGTRAAAAGGFTAVACMPNTKPVNDNGSITRFILERAQNCAARVYPTGALTSGSKGQLLAEYGEMKAAGVVALTDDGLPVSDSQLMRRAMEYAASFGLVVISHSEEIALSRNGSMNEGELSTRMGLAGIPNAAEYVMVQREIALAELTGTRLHIAHVSTAQSLRCIREAKARGVTVTAETAPHYFTLTEEAVRGYNTYAKMNPPLRSEADRQAVRKALQDGTLDAIASDHAPHTVLEKEVEFNIAANGIIGLETSLPLCLNLVREKLITPARLIELMSVAPAQILGVSGGTLQAGTAADVTVIDPEWEYTYSEENSLSKGTNSPFYGWHLQGCAAMTIVGGRITQRKN